MGKPVGIFIFTWLAVKLRLCELPTGSTWPQVLSVGMLGGIGFTVALLITDLGFDNELLVDEAKLGVLTASLAAGVLGFVLLRLTTRAPTDASSREEASSET